MFGMNARSNGNKENFSRSIQRNFSMKIWKQNLEEEVKGWMKLQRRNLGGNLEEDFIKNFRGDILHHPVIFRQEIQERFQRRHSNEGSR